MRLFGLALLGVVAVGGCNSDTGNGNGDGGCTGCSDGGGGGGDGGGCQTGCTDGGGGGDGGTTVGPASVLMHHKNPTRDGVFIDAKLTKAAVTGLHMDTSFVAKYATTGSRVFAQPLYVDNSPTGGTDLVIVATELNSVIAFKATDGSVVWSVDKSTFGDPAPQGDLQCPGNQLPGLGITGTPFIDGASRTIYFDTMTDANATPAHKIWAANLDTGTVLSGWPVDVSAKISGFNSKEQNQRGALLLLNGILYVPYGGLDGDCGDYHGWVVAVPVGNPGGAAAWKAGAPSGPGIWAPGGVSTDGTSIFVTTGNANWGTTVCNGAAPAWSSGNTNAVLRLGAGATFSGMNTDFYAPTDWFPLDCNDKDLGGSGPLLLELPGATHPHLIVQLGKDSNIYLLDRTNLGGVGAELKKTLAVANANEIINAATGYTTSQGTYVALKANGSGCLTGTGDLEALKIDSSLNVTMAWCANQNGAGSPFYTDDGTGKQGLVWGIGAEGSNQLFAFDADTGAIVFDGSMHASDQMSQVSHFNTGIAAKGRIFVAADTQLFAFTP
jgi:hypothetical protein